MNILIFGPPGSGKGTQARILADEYNLSIISVGDLLRAAVTSNNIKNAVESGNLVPDEFVHDIICKQIKSLSSNFLLDGFPRNLNQAGFLTGLLNELNQEIDYIIELQISTSVLMKRIASRFICLDCGKIYSLNCSMIKGIKCEECGSEWIKRRCDDDNIDVIKKRITEYEMQMKGLREYYLDKMLKVNAEMDVDKVSQEIKNFFNMY